MPLKLWSLRRKDSLYVCIVEEIHNIICQSVDTQCLRIYSNITLFALFKSLSVLWIKQAKWLIGILLGTSSYLRNRVSYNWYTPRKTVSVVVVKWQYICVKLSYNSNSYYAGDIFPEMFLKSQPFSKRVLLTQTDCISCCKRPKKIQKYSQSFVMSCMVARKCLWFKISSFKKIKKKLKIKCC